MDTSPLSTGHPFPPGFPSEEDKTVLASSRAAERRQSRRRRVVETLLTLGGIVAIGGVVAGAVWLMANMIGFDRSPYVDQSGFQHAVSAAGQYAEEFPDSTDPITAAAVLARDAEVTGEVQVAGSPADGWCVRSGEYRTSRWAYYDSTVGDLDPDPRQSAPATGPCHDAEWLTVR